MLALEHFGSIEIEKKSRRTIWLVLILFLASLMRFTWIGIPNLFYDESYYWEWSRRLDFGFYDHPPMVAYMIFLTTSLGGYNEFFVRLGSAILGLGTVFLAYQTGRRMFGWLAGALAALLICLVRPFIMISCMATPDSLHAFFWSLTLYFVFQAASTGKSRYWYMTGIAVGLGLLSKYACMLAIPSIFLFLLLSGNHRKWIFRKEFYIIIFVALIVFIPNLLWNATHGWVSLRYQLEHVATVGRENPNMTVPERVYDYLLDQAGLLTPVLLVLLLATIPANALLAVARKRHEFALLFSFTALTFFFFLIAGAEIHWPLPAYYSAIVALAGIFVWALNSAMGKQQPHAAPEVSKRSIWASTNKLRRTILVASFSLLLLTLGINSLYGIATLSMAIPLTPSQMTDPENETIIGMVGWHTLGREIDALMEEMSRRGETVIVAEEYGIASEIGFYTKTHYRTYSLASQYGIWGMPKAPFVNAIAVYYNRLEAQNFTSLFEEVESVSPFTVYIEGKLVKTIHIFKCYGLKRQYDFISIRLLLPALGDPVA